MISLLSAWSVATLTIELTFTVMTYDRKYVNAIMSLRLFLWAHDPLWIVSLLSRWAYLQHVSFVIITMRYGTGRYESVRVRYENPTTMVAANDGHIFL